MHHFIGGLAPSETDNMMAERAEVSRGDQKVAVPRLCVDLKTAKCAL